MKKHPHLSRLAFTLLFTQNFTHAHADTDTDTDKKLNNTKNIHDKTTLASEIISSNRLDNPFQQTNFIKENLGTSGDEADLLKINMDISVIGQDGTARGSLLRSLGDTRLKIHFKYLKDV